MQSQRRYNSFDNKWDLTILFDPGAVVLHDEDNKDEDNKFYNEYMGFRPGTPPGPPPYPPSPPPPNDVFTNDIVTTYAIGSSQYTNEVTDMDINSASMDPPDSILYYRYGFNWDGVSVYAPCQTVPDWKSTQKTFADTRDIVDCKLHVAIANFVDYLVHNVPVPAVLSDLDSQNPSPLCEDSNPRLSVTPKTYSDTMYYLIQLVGPPSPNDLSWDLMVEDPLTAIQCLREDLGPSIMDVIMTFLRTGTPFNTRIRSNKTHPALTHPRHHGKPVGLGWREKGYCGDAIDYAVYEALHTEFLAQPHACSALLKGGIIWQLARCSVKFSVASAGPLDDVFNYGSCIKSNFDGVELWDDDLSEDELNLICGVYKVKTQGNQTSDSSWWPKYSVWMSGGLNVGYWSPACEEWFEQQLDSIRNGTAHLRTLAEWRVVLRFWRSTMPFIKNSRHATAAYLCNQIIR
jgi:hypothetical protein